MLTVIVLSRGKSTTKIWTDDNSNNRPTATVYKTVCCNGIEFCLNGEGNKIWETSGVKRKTLILKNNTNKISRDGSESSVGIENRLWTGGPRNRGTISGRGKTVSSLRRPNRSWSTASYTMGTSGCTPEEKQQGREADHIFPTTAYVKNAWSFTANLQYIHMARCLIN